MAGNSELWVQCFTCCLTARSARNGGRRSNNGSRPHQRHRIDRSMIGVPTNFRHTAHISSGDIDMSIAQLADLQTQMQRKGGDLGAKVPSHPESWSWCFHLLPFSPGLKFPFCWYCLFPGSVLSLRYTAFILPTYCPIVLGSACSEPLRPVWIAAQIYIDDADDDSNRLSCFRRADSFTIVSRTRRHISCNQYLKWQTEWET